MDDERSTPSGEGVDIEFSDVSYSVTVWAPGRLLSPEKKQILKNVSGTFRRKRACAIIGCSGSGKSSLLNFLSGYKTNGFQGDISINGRPWTRKHFVKQSSYIMQDERLQPYLTVMESMEIASKLRHCTTKLDVNHNIMIKRVLEDLKLSDQQNTLAAKLSGGERRRLTIAIELIGNPKVMFFDEPTTGLDAVSANTVVSVLKDLANCGRTIIATIHQASALQLNMFDSLYVLSPTGQCIYRGEPSHLVDYLSYVGLRCPLHYNPADYVIEVSCGEYGDYNKTLVACVNNDKSVPCSENGYIEDTNGQAIDRKSCRQRLSKFSNELRILTSRSLIISYRDSDFVVVRILVPVVLSLLFGTVYFNVGKYGTNTRDSIITFFFVMMNVIQFAAYSMCVKFPMELILVRLEYFNRWYSLRSYYTCVTLVDLPLQILATTLFMAPTYLLTGMHFELFRFALLFLMMIMTSLVCQAIGMLTGVIFKHYLINLIVLSLILLPMLVFSGIMIRIRDTPEIYRWYYDVSVLKHAMQGILHAAYGYNRSTLPCPTVYCQSSYPELILKDVDMTENIFWTNFAFLTSVYILLKIFTYVVLKRKLSR